jgi:hypothetical protein
MQMICSTIPWAKDRFRYFKADFVNRVPNQCSLVGDAEVSVNLKKQFYLCYYEEKSKI